MDYQSLSFEDSYGHTWLAPLSNMPADNLTYTVTQTMLSPSKSTVKCYLDRGPSSKWSSRLDAANLIASDLLSHLSIMRRYARGILLIRNVALGVEPIWKLSLDDAPLAVGSWPAAMEIHSISEIHQSYLRIADVANNFISRELGETIDYPGVTITHPTNSSPVWHVVGYDRDCAIASYLTDAQHTVQTLAEKLHLLKLNFFARNATSGLSALDVKPLFDAIEEMLSSYGEGVEYQGSALQDGLHSQVTEYGGVLQMAVTSLMIYGEQTRFKSVLCYPGEIYNSANGGRCGKNSHTVHG
jgi:hypothetical protein